MTLSGALSTTTATPTKIYDSLKIITTGKFPNFPSTTMESTINKILEAFKITANKEKRDGPKNHSNKFRGFLSNEKDALADNKSMWNSDYGLFADSQTVSLRADEFCEYDSAECQDQGAGPQYRRNDKSLSPIHCGNKKSPAKSRTRKLGVPGQLFARSVSLEGDRAKELSNMVEEWATGEPVGSARFVLRRSSSLDFSIGTNSPLTDDISDDEESHEIHVFSDEKPVGYSIETDRYQRHSPQEFMDDAIGVYTPNEEERCRAGIELLQDLNKDQGWVRALPQDQGKRSSLDIEAKHSGSCSKVITKQHPTLSGHPTQREKSRTMLIKASSISSEVASMSSSAAADAFSKKNIRETSIEDAVIAEPHQTRENYVDDAIMKSAGSSSRSNIDIAAYERWMEASEEIAKDSCSTHGIKIACSDIELHTEASTPDSITHCYDENIAHDEGNVVSDSSQNSMAGKNPHKSETVFAMNINNGMYFVGKERRSSNRRASFNGLSAVKEDAKYLQATATSSESLKHDTNSSLDNQLLDSNDENITITKALSSLDINGNPALQPSFCPEQGFCLPEMRQPTIGACEIQVHMPSQSQLVSADAKESGSEFQGIQKVSSEQGGQIEEPLWYSPFVMGGDFHDMQRNASKRHMRLRRDSPFAFPMIEELARNMGREAVARGISAAGQNKLSTANLGPGHFKQKHKKAYCS